MMFNCILIGLGSIGFSYDVKLQNSNIILTHAKAITSNKELKLLYGVDVNSTHRDNFTKKYGLPTHSNLTKIVDNEQVDLIVIATPTELHLENFKESTHKKPKVLLLEKPIANDFLEAKFIKNEYLKYKIPTFVNYQRFIHREFELLSTKIINKDIPGKFQIVCWFSGGLINNGSHMVNLLQKLFSENKFGKLKFTKNATLLNHYNFRNLIVQGTMIRLTDIAGDYFAFEAIGSKHRIKYDSNANTLSIASFKENLLIDGHFSIDETITPIDMKEESLLANVYHNLVAFLKNETYTLCDFNIAMSTLERLNYLTVQESGE